MYEIKQLGPRTYALLDRVNLGVYLPQDGGAVLIDSGLDEGNGKRVLKLFEAQGWTLTHLVNTHSHADHIGGNAVLQARTDCRILASAAEAPFVAEPWLESAVLNGGNPDASLRNKFLLAKPSRVDCILPDGLPQGLSTVALPGHSPGMTGILTADGVLFLGDAVLGGEQIKTHAIPYVYDVGQYLRSLDALSETQADWYVPGHGEISRDIAPLLSLHRTRVMDQIGAMLALCKLPVPEEALFRVLRKQAGVPDDPSQYALSGNTLRGYAAYLLGAGLLEQAIEDGQRVFCAAERA